MTAEPLGQHAQFIRGITFKPTDKCAVGAKDSLVCLRTANVQQSLDESDLIAIPASIVKKPDKVVRTGDILVSSANSWNLVGKCCRVGSLRYPSTAGGFISILRADPSRLDAAYLYRWFSSDRTQATVRSFGNQTTNISNLDHHRTLSLPIPLPPLPEQKRIAAILDAADALRERRRESIEQLDSLIQATFLEMFGDPVTNPKGWELVPLSEITFCLDRLRKPVKEEERKAGTVPYYGANGQQGWIDSPIFNESLVLVAEDGGHFDKPSRGVAYRIEGPSWVNNHAHVLRPLPKVNIEYLHRSLRNYDFTPYISGTTRAKLNQKQMSRATVLLPPLDLQTRFASIVESIEQQKARLKAHLTELDTLFASLQSRAFNGELVA